MVRPRKKRLPYQFTPAGFVAVATAFSFSLGLFWYAWADLISENIVTSSVFLSFVVGASLMGASLGAAIGHIFRDDRGGTALMGAFIGAIVAPPLLLVLLVHLMFAIWMAMGHPSA
jgi:hypothetical protein